MNEYTDGLRVCGLKDCDRFGSSLDPRHGRLCSKHNQRLRRQRQKGTSEDEAYALLETTVRPKGNSVRSEPAAALNIEKVKARIVEPIAAKVVHPLLLFLGGNQTEGRIKSLYHLLGSAKDAEIKTFTSITKATELLTDPVHYCGLHGTVARMSLWSFCSRLWKSPEVLALEPDWQDYLEFLFQGSGVRGPLDLREISATSRRTRRPWRLIYHVPIAPMAEHWPFITGKPTDDHGLILAIDSLVPKGLLSDVRADICQDMIVAVLTGETTLDNLRDAPVRYIKQFFKQSPSKYGPLSLDTPLDFGEKNGRTIGGTIMAHR